MSKKVTMLTYQSLSEFLDAVSAHPPSHTTRDPDWAGVATFGQAVKLAASGWDAILPEVEALCLQVEDRVDLERFDVGFQATYDVAGAEVDVSRFLSGDPECMVESLPVRISRHGRAVRLVVPVGFLAQVNGPVAEARGAAVLALVDLLAVAGHPVEIWAVSHSHPSGSRTAETIAVAVKVQEATDPVDVGRLSFVLAHRAMFRHLMFACRAAYAPKRMGFVYGGEAGTKELTQEVLDLLGPVDGTVLTIPTLSPSDNWRDAEYAAQWVADQLARIFD